jgi:hypothetical protein
VNCPVIWVDPPVIPVPHATDGSTCGEEMTSSSEDDRDPATRIARRGAGGLGSQLLPRVLPVPAEVHPDRP